MSSSTAQLIPMNAQQQWEAQQKRPRVYRPDYQTATGYPLKNVQVTRPVNPWGPSFNVNEIPFRGWNMSGLNSYPIPRHDRLQLGLFNRFVLQNPDALPALAQNNSLLGKAALQIAQRGNPLPGNATLPLPQRYRYGFGGKQNTGTRTMATGS